MRNKGFTLVELMIVVAILGILTTVAIPLYNGYISSVKKGEAKANLETIRLLEEQYYADRRQYVEAANTAALKTALPGFEPGNDANLHYEYSVECPTTQTFTATATPKASAPSGNLTIDQANNKNW